MEYLFSIEFWTTNINNIIVHPQFLLIVFSLAFLLKIFIMFRLILHKRHSSRTGIQLTLLLLAIGGSTILNSAWIMKIFYRIFPYSLDPRFVRFWIRITWAFNTLHYHSLALFIESLVTKKDLIRNVRQKILMPISGALFTFFIVLSVVGFQQPTIRPIIELVILKIIPYYFLIPILLVSLIITAMKLRSEKIPRLLKKQFNIFIKILFIPIVTTELIHFQPIRHLYLSKRYTITCISTLLLTYVLYYFIKKIIGLRFLNLKSHVQSSIGFYFSKDFKNILEKFSNITNTRELIHITKSFFKDAFSIPIQKTHLYIRKHNYTLQDENKSPRTPDESSFETFLKSQKELGTFEKLLSKEKIVINDELTFSNFYDEDPTQTKTIIFLNHLNADIFIPVYDKHELIAYIIIERYARIGHVPKNEEFYSNLERDQMIVFANYLGNTINLIKSRNLTSIIKNEKTLKDNLHIKENENILYKEAIKTFIKHNNEKEIGIVFYKNRHFSICNQIAQTLISVNLNTHTGHPTTKIIKKIANQVLEYKSPKTCFIQNAMGEKLVVSGIPNAENNNVIITVRHPEISDVIKNKIFLQDPTTWEYILFLEKTEQGKLINQLIPGDGETIINFKVNLLKAALKNNAILLDIPEPDIIPTAELLHHISLRETLHIIDLQKPSKDITLAIKLFGINPLFGINQKDKPLFEKLSDTGTLFIKNIHFASKDIQKYIGEYLHYGFYKTFKGDRKKSSNLRIILSTNRNLKTDVQDNSFSKTLYDGIKHALISMPSLDSLPAEEISNLIIAFAKQAIKTNEFHRLLELTESEKRKLLNTPAKSLKELKAKVKNILIKKSKKHSIYEEAQFDPAYNITDPDLVEAARLGKHALKDPKIMIMLWNKFNKNQNKIANLLGVNRSSVNRRCKDYNLEK